MKNNNEVMEKEIRIKGFKCNKCSFETTKRGILNAQFEIKEHLEEIHPEIIKEIKEIEDYHNNEIQKIYKRVPQISLGNFITSIPSKPNKQWTCPRCGEQMSYNHKYYHQQNATRKGEDYYCKKKNH